MEIKIRATLKQKMNYEEKIGLSAGAVRSSHWNVAQRSEAAEGTELRKYALPAQCAPERKKLFFECGLDENFVSVSVEQFLEKSDAFFVLGV